MTTTAGPPTTENALSTAAEQTWVKLRTIREQIRDLKKLEDDLSSQLRQELGRGEFAAADGPSLQIYATKRFDSDLAARILPADLLAEVQKTVIDGKLLKAKLVEKGLPVALYEMCQVEGDKDTVRALS